MSRHLPPRAETWTVAPRIAYLERRIRLCEIEPRDDRVWKHHKDIRANPGEAVHLGNAQPAVVLA